MAAYSTLGEHAAIWFVLAGVAALRAPDDETRRAAGRAGAAILGTFAVNVAIKNVVRRRRPTLEGLPPLVGTPTGLSFPSTHAGTSFAGARALARAGLPAVPLRALAARSQAAMQEARDAMEQALVKVTADLHAPPRDTRPVADPGPAAEVVAESVPDSPPTSTSPSTTQPEKEATP